MAKHQAGLCAGWRPGPKWREPDCYVCWRDRNIETRRGKGKPPAENTIVSERRERKKPEPRPPCIHLGEISYAPHGCRAGKEIRFCNHPENEASRCTVLSNCGKDKDIASCAKCELYVSGPLSVSDVPQHT